MSDDTQSIDSQKVVAVVIGRAGSKGLPGKNLLPIGGKPMIAHSVDHACGSQLVGRVLCSTDGAEIAAAAEDAGAEIVMRPADLASDTATVDSALRHAITDSASDAEYVVMLYGNVPIRPPGLVDRAVEELVRSGADSVQSYGPVGKHHPYWTVRIDDHGVVDAWQDHEVYRRQDLPPAFIPDGGVVVVTRSSLFDVGSGHPHAFLGKVRRGIKNPEGSVVDVDDRVDYLLARALFEERAT